MDSKFGHRLPILVVIPTRKLNSITLNNIEIFYDYFCSKKLVGEIIVVSNSDEEDEKKSYRIIHNTRKNAAVSRNLGVKYSEIKHGLFVYLDDDIILDSLQLNSFFDYLLSSDKQEIFAPYISGLFLENNYEFGFFVKKYYSWLLNQEINKYSDIQGKSIFCFNYPPIKKSVNNSVEWIPGGFMVFRNFSKNDVYFDENIFDFSYYMEDFFLSNIHFLNGIPITVSPFVFQHQLLYDKLHSKPKVKFKEIYLTERNRMIIQRERSNYTKESMTKYKFIVALNYIYRLKGFKLENLVSLIAIIYLFVWKSRK
jgi:hypothetical protein